MAKIYTGVGSKRRIIGEYENGIIYSGSGWNRTQIGEYERNNIYKGRGWGRTLIGLYEISGGIYSVSSLGYNKTRVGLCENGRVYVTSEYGYSRTQVGEYDGNSAGGAALLLLF